MTCLEEPSTGYIDTFREAGFVIKKSGDRIRLDKRVAPFPHISQPRPLHRGGGRNLKNAIENIDDTNLLKEPSNASFTGLRQPIARRYGRARKRTPPNIRRFDRGDRGAAPSHAHGYQSGQRRRGPRPPGRAFALTTNYVQVWCYDLESRSEQALKKKTARIGSVEPSATPGEHQAEHEEGFIDVFRMHGAERHRIRLERKLLAYNLL